MIPGFSFARSSSGQVQRVRRIYPTHAINEIVVSNNANYQVNISNNAAFLARLTNSIYVEYIGFIRALAIERQGGRHEHGKGALLSRVPCVDVLEGCSARHMRTA